MPVDPRWTGPPEAIASTFEAGSPASVVSNNLVWVTETSHHEVAAGVSGANTAATLASWQGVGSGASAAAATGLNAGLQATAGWTAHKIAVTQGAIDAFATARSAVIPSVIIQANRTEREAMDQANPSVLWSFTPAITERDLEYYGQHWPHNSTIGMGYSTAMSGFTAALGMPTLAPAGASPAAPAAAGDAVAQAAATTGAQDGVSLSSQAAQAVGQAPASSASGVTDQLGSLLGPLQQAASSAIQPMTSVFQTPMQGLQSLSSLPSSLMGATSGMFSSASASASEAAEMAAAAGPLASGGSAAGGLGAGAASAMGGAGAFSGAGLTSYTRPTSTFEPETGGRPTGLRTVAATSGPTTSMGSGMTGMPVSPAAMAARGNGEDSSQQAVTHARIVVAGNRVASE